MELAFLDEIKDRLATDWHPVSKWALGAWLVFYGLFLWHAGTDADGFLLIDHANLIVHEAGHLLFGWFGATLGLWGGTLLELLVPLALAFYFALQRHAAGTAFATFFFFENFLYIARYMANAQTQTLPLVTVGDPAAGGHDWFLIFSSLGVLSQDRLIARVVEALGWAGMLATVGWLIRCAQWKSGKKAYNG
ncbi:MAG: hypothetical protein HY313_01920 [Acidobacteria bacterium]|nr:hypothetical protein [Acidobacteriota bacterium]